MNELEQFYEEFVEKVYKYFYVNCLDRHRAEDLTSHTFVEFISKAQQQTIDDKKKYLYGIMRRVWADYLRLKYKEIVDSVESIDDFEAHTVSTVDQFEAKDMKARALTFITKLPNAQRQVAYMRLIEEKKIREIAYELGKSVIYVKTTQSRAVRSLRNMLAQPEVGGEFI